MILTDLGGYVESKVAVIPAEFGNAGTVDGPAIDRTGFLSAVLVCLLGATSGTPTAISVSFAIQHSDVSGSGFAAVTDAAGVAVTKVVTTANSVAELNIDLSGYKKYVRVVPTITLSNGSAPKIKAAAALVLGGKNVNPA